MKKNRMKKNSAVIIKVEADRLKTSWDVKDNENDSNGQMESFKTSELMYCLAQFIYNAHFVDFSKQGKKCQVETSWH